MIFTPQEIIQDSLTHFKEEQAKARREEVRKSLDYYSGSLTHQYIEDYFKSDAFPRNSSLQYEYREKICKSYVQDIYDWC